MNTTEGHSGIYALYWWEQDLVYVGQSQNIPRRFREHKYKLSVGTHTNYKVAKAFSMYGMPDIVVLQLAQPTALNSLEIWWTNQFDSLNGINGLNIIEPGVVGFGSNSNNSKYSKLELLKVFRLLYSTDLTYGEISKLAHVPKSLICSIYLGESHLWLKYKYPTSYAKMVRMPRRFDINYKLKYQGNKYVIVVSPDNAEHKVTNIREFCRVNGLKNTCMGEVIRGKRAHHKGWKLKSSPASKINEG